MQELLDQARAAQSDALREVERMRPSAAEERALAGFRAQIAEEALRARRTAGRRYAGLAAAALILAVAGWFALRTGRDGEQAGRDSTTLGAADSCAQPIGGGADFTCFRWVSALPANGWFDVVVEDAAPAGDGGEVARARHLRANEWRPAEIAVARWPDRIRWTVEKYDASGTLVKAFSAEASRSP